MARSPGDEKQLRAALTRSYVLLFGSVILVLLLVLVVLPRWRGGHEQIASVTPQVDAQPSLPPLSAAQPAAQPLPAPERLAPQLLRDSEEIAAYVEAFPQQEYAVAEVAGLGSFYLDEGQDLIKDTLRRGELWEPHLVKQLLRLAEPGSVVIDAGAHIGTHSLALAHIVGPAGRVYAFEPQRKIYRELVRNMRLNEANNVVPLRFALGDEAGIIEMNPATAANEGSTAIGEGGDPAELRTIDSFGFEGVSLMKIDVESFEEPVLAGARDTISRCRPKLLVEIQGAADFDDAFPVDRARIVHTITMIESMDYYVVRASQADYIGVPKEQLAAFLGTTPERLAARIDSGWPAAPKESDE